MEMEHGAVQFSPATSSPQGLLPQPSPTHVRIAPSRGNQQQKWEQAATGQEESCKKCWQHTSRMRVPIVDLVPIRRRFH